MRNSDRFDLLRSENNSMTPLRENDYCAKSTDEFDECIDYSKMKVECICPKCGQRHVMNFKWIGRGIKGRSR